MKWYKLCSAELQQLLILNDFSLSSGIIKILVFMTLDEKNNRVSSGELVNKFTKNGNLGQIVMTDF